MDTDLIINIGGGLGLLLLGMKLLSDGLKLAGGPVLRRILKSWTKTPLRGLASGFVITSLVQSSSAVTVAIIGFLNAGLMRLRRAVWAVYGSNIGTTSTAWIVAFLGLKINIRAMALPFIAMGTALWLIGGVSRRGSLGEAIAGFGVFFVGIEVLQHAFLGLGDGVDLHHLNSSGMLGALAFVGVGFAMTCVMQSSSAAMALILTATAGGIVPVSGAAAAVIGANVGTTSTAALAVIGATPKAKRLAMLHVIFNCITGIVAFALMPALLAAIEAGRRALHLPPDIAASLAVFHTSFNVMGVLILFPFTRLLVRLVNTMFRTVEEDEGSPKYLDDTVVRTPVLGLNALILESGRIAEVARRMVRTALMCHPKPCREFAVDKAILQRLQRTAGEFAATLSREGMSRNSADLLPRILRVSQYFNVSAEMAAEADTLFTSLEPHKEESLAKAVHEMARKAEQITLLTDVTLKAFNRNKLNEAVDAFETSYQAAKQAFLASGSDGHLTADQMVQHLEWLSRIRRMVQQMLKGARLLDRLRRQLSMEPQDMEENSF